MSRGVLAEFGDDFPCCAPSWARTAGDRRLARASLAGSAEVLACSPIGAHVHTVACLTTRATARPRCIHCRATTVVTELGACHEVTGMFGCPAPLKTSAEVSS